MVNGDISQSLSPFRPEVRQVWHNDEWYYAIVDIIAFLLPDSKDPGAYWRNTKKRLLEDEGAQQALDQIIQLKLKAQDGRFRLTDTANRQTLFRIIQSIPSPKAEPFKIWLAESGEQQLQLIETTEIDDPELAKERLRRDYERDGRSPTWIKLRLDGIDIRKKLTNEWQIRGIISGREFAILTNHISEETFGIPTQSHRDLKGLKKQDLREHYTDIEHALINLSEAATHEFTVQRDSRGFEPIQQDAIDGGRVGGRARADLESQGLKVVSEQNFLPAKKKSKKAIQPPLLPEEKTESE